MIIPSRLPRPVRKSPRPRLNDVGTAMDNVSRDEATTEATSQVAGAAADTTDADTVTDTASDTGSSSSEMICIPITLDDKPPIYIMTDHGWKEPSLAEALAATIPFEDPELPPPTSFGMDLRDAGGRVALYTRQPNDDVGVSPISLMSDGPGHVPASPDVTSVELSDPAVTASDHRRVLVNLPKTPDRRAAVRRRTSEPHPEPTAPASRKRKASDSPSSPPSSSRNRPRRSNSAPDTLPSIIELSESPSSSDSDSDSDYSDDDATMVGSSPIKQQDRDSEYSPQKIRPRPPHSSGSSGSSPLKPASTPSFAPYACHIPGCAFTASSAQHIKHHYESFQHGRVVMTRGRAR